MDVAGVFSDVAGCRKFVYKVRNNIFHGSKRIGETWDTDHARRIQLYLDFRGYGRVPSVSSELQSHLTPSQKPITY